MEDSTTMAYVFDADGTLTDSVPAYIKFCNDQNEKGRFGLKAIDTKDHEAVRNVIGLTLDGLFRNYGFPESEVTRLKKVHAKIFPFDPKYKSRVFPGVNAMLRSLRQTGNPIAILTLNRRETVARDLGRANCRYIDVFIDGDHIKDYYEGSKGNALHSLISDDWKVNPGLVTCIGDRELDYEAARQAECNFIGVSYGWGFNPNERRFPVVSSVPELESKLRNGSLVR